MCQHMTEKDWVILNQSWLDSYSSYSCKAEEERKVESYKQDFLYEVGDGTFKARFFCTAKVDGKVMGFWVPRSAIVGQERKRKRLKIATWCKLKIIEYKRG